MREKTIVDNLFDRLAASNAIEHAVADGRSFKAEGKYHAIVMHSHIAAPRVVQRHTIHRTQAAAARSLSKGISAACIPAPGYVTWCAIVAPDGRVMSLRQAQGKAPGEVWPNLAADMREVAAQ